MAIALNDAIRSQRDGFDRRSRRTSSLPNLARVWISHQRRTVDGFEVTSMNEFLQLVQVIVVPPIVRDAGAPVVCETPGGAAEHVADFAWLRAHL